MRELRADQYGLRTALLVAGQPIKFEIILEGRVSLHAPGAGDTLCGIATLTPLDMATSKLLANSDHWMDDGVFSRLCCTTGTSHVVKRDRHRVFLIAMSWNPTQPRCFKQGTDCTSTDGLIAHSAAPDTNRSAGLHSNLVTSIGATLQQSSLPAAGLTCSKHL